MKKKDSIGTIVVAALLIGVVGLMIWNSDRTASRQGQRTSEALAQSDLIVTDIKTAPVEYQLAYLDADQLPRGNDVNAARVRYLLKTLSEKTGDTPQSIADRTHQSTTVLKRDYGKAVTNQQFLEEANEHFKAGGPKLDYESLATMLVAMKGK